MEQSQPQRNPNVPSSNPEKAPQPEQSPQRPEQQPEQQHEQKPERAAPMETKTGAKDPSGALVLPQVADRPAVADSQNSSQQDSGGSDYDFPLIADDVDVIEKQWVDKAKEIIRETKDDPHAQEEAVERLQADYLKKRYGKDIKTSN